MHRGDPHCRRCTPDLNFSGGRRPLKGKGVCGASAQAMKPDACWIIGDMSSLESQAANVHSHPLAPLLYGFSCHLCLPSGLSTPDGLGLGTTGLPTVLPNAGVDGY
jgi:hypothetical protein